MKSFLRYASNVLYIVQIKFTENCWAITQRGTAKDFFDLNALMQTFGMTLDYLISLVKKKYGVSEDYSYQIKRGLVYFDDAVKSLGDVTVIRNGKQVRLDKRLVCRWTRLRNRRIEG